MEIVSEMHGGAGGGGCGAGEDPGRRLGGLGSALAVSVSSERVPVGREIRYSNSGIRGPRSEGRW